MPQIISTLPSDGEPPKAFTCHHCGVYSGHDWTIQVIVQLPRAGQSVADELKISRCDHCQKSSVWHHLRLVSPQPITAPEPNPDMPSVVEQVYREAAGVEAQSSRAAVALLRLAIQLLCQELKCESDNLNKAIAELVSRGLPVQVQQALDIVRVTGNNAVHPGTIDVEDEGVASSLFDLVNLITETMISQPKQIEAMYQSLPQGARDAINERDSQPPTT